MDILVAERALIAGAPVEYATGTSRLTYKEIYGLIFRRNAQSGGYDESVKLADSCGHSFTTARLDQVKLLTGWEGKLPEKLPPVYEDGPTPTELNAKKALKTGCPVLFNGERWRVTALEIRNWTKLDYWLSVELTRISDGLVEEAWAGSVILECSKR